MMTISHVTPGQPVRTTGNNLVGLWRPSFIKVDQRLFVYGGGGNVTNDLHVLNLHDMRWETLQTSKGTPPCKRYGHTATLWNNCIIIFGGCNEFQEYCQDVHIYDIEKMTWHQPDITGTVPARYLHSAVVFDNKLFVYGGFAKNSDCTYVLDELSVLDLTTMTWTKYHGIPPRYNHSATLIGHKVYIYAGKDEHGNTVSDLFVINLTSPPYTPHLVLSGAQSNANSQMVLLKSQHFCEAVCGRLLVFGRYLVNGTQTPQANPEAMYGLWMLNLDTLEWQRQECSVNFEVGGWNYFTVISESTRSGQFTNDPSEAVENNLFFLGNTDPFRSQGYDHFRDALIINGESLGLYDIRPPQFSHEFAQLLNNPELSDFTIVPSNGQELRVHRVILITRWPHFRNIYKSGMLEAQQQRMEIPEPYEVVLAFLKYLYTDDLDENEPWPIVCEVLVIANMYLLSRLKKICCDRLYRRHLTVESCGLIFEKSIIAEEVGLKLLTLNFMFRNYGIILKSNILSQMPPMILQEFLSTVPDDAVLEVNNRSIAGKYQSPNKYSTLHSSQRGTFATGSIALSRASSSTISGLFQANQPQQTIETPHHPQLSYSSNIHILSGHSSHATSYAANNNATNIVHMRQSLSSGSQPSNTLSTTVPRSLSTANGMSVGV